MLTAVEAAAVIAAIAFAVLAAAGVYALIKLARLISDASGVAADFRVRSELLLGRANSAVDRAHEQLVRTGDIATSMDEVSSNIANLTADMSMLTGAMRTLLDGPLGRLAGFTFGVRRAIALRRSGPQHPWPMRATARGGPSALPAGRAQAAEQRRRSPQGPQGPQSPQSRQGQQGHQSRPSRQRNRRRAMR
jgi:hypothetical protein